MKIKKLFVILAAVLCSFAFVLAGCQGDKESNKVTVGFDLNFRTIEDDPENIEVTPGAAYGELPTVDVENEGYTFLEWNTKANGKGETIDADTIVSEDIGDHTLYAIWKGNTYTVSYELNGGSVNGAETLPTQTVTFGSMYGAMVIPSDPEKPLSEFLGWYLNPDGEGAPVSYNSDVRTAKDHTLYAIYRDLREVYDFSTYDQINDFVNVDHAGMEIVEDENGNYLKLTPVNFEADTPASDLYSILMLKTPLKAGKVVEIDCEVVGEIVDAWGFWTWGAVSTGDIQFEGQKITKWENPALWNDGKFTSYTEITENCAGLRIQFRYVGNADAYWKITGIRIKDAGDVTPPVVETRTEYDFTTSDQVNYFGKATNVSYTIEEDENGNYLKVTGVPGSANTFMLKHELTAGMKVTVDVEYVAENVAFGDGNQITFLTYGSNVNGDADGNTYAVIGNAKWDGGWDCAKVRTVSEIVADCAGIRMQFVFNSEEGAYFKITNIKVYNADEQVEELPKEEPPVVEPPVVEPPVVETRTEYDFTTADQINGFGKANNVNYEIVDGYLKVSKATDGTCTLVLNRELTAGMKVTVDVEYVGTNLAYASGNQITFLTYGANAAGDADGNTYAVLGNAKWDGGWDCAKVRTVSEIAVDCAGLRMQFVFNGEADAYFKITNVRIYNADEQVEELPKEEPPVVELRTEYDFTTEDQKAEFSSLNNGVVEINTAEGYLKFSPADKTIDNDNMPQAEFLYKRALTAGLKVQIEFELVGAINVGHGIWMYGVNENSHNLFEGAYYTAWDTPDVWNSGKFTAVFEVAQDCAGIKFLVRFAKNPDAYWKISSIKIVEAGQEPPVVEERTEYDFSTADQIDDFDKAKNVSYEIVDGYLKVVGTAGSESTLVLWKDLTAGQTVEIDVEYVCENPAYSAGQVTFLAYTANANGDNDGKTTAVMGNAKWDGGWDCAKTTVSVAVTQDCAGVRMQFVMNSEANAYFKITAIRIIDAQ